MALTSLETDNAHVALIVAAHEAALAAANRDHHDRLRIKDYVKNFRTAYQAMLELVEERLAEDEGEDEDENEAAGEDEH